MNETNINTCPEEDELSAFVDGDLEDERQSAVEAHLENCAACAEIEDQLRELTGSLSADGLMEPPDYLWTRIEARRKEEVSSSVGARLMSWLTSGFRLPIAGAAAAAVVAIVVLSNQTVDTEGGKASESESEIAKTGDQETEKQIEMLSKVTEAEKVYASAISSLEQSFEQKKDNYSDETLDTITTTLADVDIAIGKCQEMVEKEPGNIEAHRTALALYQRKVDLLSELVIDPL